MQLAKRRLAVARSDWRLCSSAGVDPRARLGGRGTGDGAQQAWIMLGVAASGVNAEGNVGTPEVGGHGKAEGAEADHPHPQVTSGHGWRGVSSEFRCWTRHSAFSWTVSA